MLPNWTQPWDVNFPIVDWLNPLESMESIMENQFKAIHIMQDTFLRWLDIGIAQNACDTMFQPWQSTAETWKTFFPMINTQEKAEVVSEEIESLKTQNTSLAEQIASAQKEARQLRSRNASLKKDATELKRTINLQKKTIDTHEASDTAQQKTIAAKDKEIATLKKELESYKKREGQQRGTVVATKDKNAVAPASKNAAE